MGLCFSTEDLFIYSINVFQTTLISHAKDKSSSGSRFHRYHIENLIIDKGMICFLQKFLGKFKIRSDSKYMFLCKRISIFCHFIRLKFDVRIHKYHIYSK